MKTLVPLFLLLGIAVSAAGADSSIELRGVIVNGRETKLSLAENAAAVARWAALGQFFGGYRVTAYDASSESATLTKDGQELRLKLKPSRVADGPPPSAIPPTHQVAVGDSANRIAARYHLTFAELQALNPDVEWARLRVGQTVKLK